MTFRDQSLRMLIQQNLRKKVPLKPEEKFPYEPSLCNWGNYFQERLEIPTGNGDIVGYLTLPQPDSCLFVLQHGAGSSAMSFGPMVHELLSESEHKVGFLSLDLRAHGETSVKPEKDMSLQTLTNDFVHAVQYVQNMFHLEGKMILVGHSLGGSICTEAAVQKRLPNVSGLVMIDAVEGTAMESFSYMRRYVITRPTSFSSVEEAISWHLKTLTIRQRTSACITVPSLLIPSEDRSCYTWRTDLNATSPFWSGWFTGLDDKFLKAACGKMLIVAGADRLDKSLIIGQMQGKYQLEISPASGHFVHEDVPSQMASLLIKFWHRNQPLVLPKKLQL
ncbi:carboxyl methyl esterase [Schizosaccharomyces cryophilus OY26]|uniref:Protein phosphatase methylesterase 1 n=1 Tax=Schizosaccharomyces cryophilus (strain OY26 / ATCC MYA-4695 / CBS 11777 / NBRC 106824 / NRRL Y48691) TaxID=653667 RepID=S9X9B8_SCHCR|nr:carboxyl methyl esterase [Schizosaccharomyces cryophilus OY26]EPY53802.1 carboxyl methyl esterase [Schizosaccharomyces cryophilus OY26]